MGGALTKSEPNESAGLFKTHHTWRATRTLSGEQLALCTKLGLTFSLFLSPPLSGKGKVPPTLPLWFFLSLSFHILHTHTATPGGVGERGEGCGPLELLEFGAAAAVFPDSIQHLFSPFIYILIRIDERVLCSGDRWQHFFLSLCFLSFSELGRDIRKWQRTL